MRLRDIEEFSRGLAEGFLADKIYGDRDYVRAKLYVDSIIMARGYLQCGAASKPFIEALGRYIRFLIWLRIHYGNRTVNTSTDAEVFLYEKLNAISSNTEDFELFWGWLRKVTLEEGGRFLDI